VDKENVKGSFESRIERECNVESSSLATCTVKNKYNVNVKIVGDGIEVEHTSYGENVEHSEGPPSEHLTNQTNGFEGPVMAMAAIAKMGIFGVAATATLGGCAYGVVKMNLEEELLRTETSALKFTSNLAIVGCSGWLGAVAGAKYGAALGTWFGPMGTIIGLTGGGLGGLLLGAGVKKRSSVEHMIKLNKFIIVRHWTNVCVQKFEERQKESRMKCENFLRCLCRIFKKIIEEK
jgi:hypothetical protein